MMCVCVCACEQWVFMYMFGLMLSFNRKRIDWIDRKLETMEKLFIKVCFKQLPDKVNAQLLKSNEEISDSIAHDRWTIQNKNKYKKTTNAHTQRCNAKRKKNTQENITRAHERRRIENHGRKMRAHCHTTRPPTSTFHMHESLFMCSIYASLN